MVSSLSDPLRPPSPTSAPQDKLTSVVIPLAFAATGTALLVKGLDDLSSWGKNRKEGLEARVLATLPSPSQVYTTTTCSTTVSSLAACRDGRPFVNRTFALASIERTKIPYRIYRAFIASSSIPFAGFGLPHPSHLWRLPPLSTSARAIV